MPEYGFGPGAVKVRTIPGVNYAVQPYPGQPTLVVKDFNGNGIPELAVGFAGGVRLLLGPGAAKRLDRTILLYASQAKF
jgi:hypothetical protein